MIKTISKINDDSSKIVKLLGEANFIKRNRKQKELIHEKLYDDMPKEIINHIETFYIHVINAILNRPIGLNVICVVNVFVKNVIITKFYRIQKKKCIGV